MITPNIVYRIEIYITGLKFDSGNCSIRYPITPCNPKYARRPPHALPIVIASDFSAPKT